MIGALLTCGPFAISALAFLRALSEYRGARIPRSALWPVSGVLLIAAYAAYTFIYHTLKPSPSLPPWKDPETLNLALLFLLAPVGIIFAVVAGVCGSSKWVVVPLFTASLVLFLVGILEAMSV